MQHSPHMYYAKEKRLGLERYDDSYMQQCNVHLICIMQRGKDEAWKDMMIVICFNAKFTSYVLCKREVNASMQRSPHMYYAKVKR